MLRNDYDAYERSDNGLFFWVLPDAEITSILFSIRPSC